MSRRVDPGRRAQAAVFAALGNGTRLLLVGKLCRGEPRSISELTEGSHLTRQAVTKHLRALEDAGLAHGARRGREIRFQLTPQPIADAAKYLKLVSDQWEQALARLKSFVESPSASEPPVGSER